MRALILAAALALAGCGTTRTPEPVVQTVEIKTPVPVRCDPDIGPEPVYADAPDAIAAAADIFDRVRLVLAGREQRIARDEVKTAALRGCAGLPDPSVIEE